MWLEWPYGCSAGRSLLLMSSETLGPSQCMAEFHFPCLVRNSWIYDWLFNGRKMHSAPFSAHICKHCRCLQIYSCAKTITVRLSFLFGYCRNEQRDCMNMYTSSLLDLIELDHCPVILLQSHLLQSHFHFFVAPFI